MGSKKFQGKTCAYCAAPGISRVREHVISREFFLTEDRGNLPCVPACEMCNGKKSELEAYILAVLPLASRHEDARRYASENIARRLHKNPAVRNKLLPERTGMWEAHPTSGLLVPVVSLPIDMEKLTSLLGYIVRGLYMFHWGEALDKNWFADVTVFREQHEPEIFSRLAPFLGASPKWARRNLGRGTFVYAGIRSAAVAQFSLWQCSIFGGAQVGGDPRTPNQAFTRFTAITRQPVAADAVRAEKGLRPTAL